MKIEKKLYEAAALEVKKKTQTLLMLSPKRPQKLRPNTRKMKPFY